MAQFKTEEKKIAIVGLGYVGLPLAVEFAKKYPVVGFDINEKRVQDLKAGDDYTLEVSRDDLIAVLKDEATSSRGIYISNDVSSIKHANFYLVTVPTPIDKFNRPDLTPLYKAKRSKISN